MGSINFGERKIYVICGKTMTPRLVSYPELVEGRNSE